MDLRFHRLHKQFPLPEKARATNLLNEIIGFRFRNEHLVSDLREFLILKNRHETTTGRPLKEEEWSHTQEKAKEREDTKKKEMEKE